MNGLEALKHIKEDDFPVMIASYPPMPATLGGYTKEELFSIIEEELKDGEKHKKALEIIKEHEVIVPALLKAEDVSEYNKGWLIKKNEITQDKFDLIKEVMK